MEEGWDEGRCWIQISNQYLWASTWLGFLVLRGSLSTSNSKKTQVKETTAGNEGGTVGAASTQKDIVESTSIVSTMLTINFRKTTK